MSNDAASTDAEATGLQLLLAGGLADAMAAVETTLGGVQSAARQAFAGLSLVQAAGATAYAVPPATAEAVAPATEAALTDAAPVPAPGEGGEGGAPLAAAPVVTVAAEAARAPAAPSAPAWPAGDAPAPAAPPLPAPVTLASFAPVTAGPLPSLPTTGEAEADDAPPPPAVGERYDPTRRQQAYAPPLAAVQPATGAMPELGASPRAMAPPPSHAQAGGPTGGDVFLDGSRVGTWIADHLAREAGRPQAGGTGFDSRMTAAWPGTLQGG